LPFGIFARLASTVGLFIIKLMSPLMQHEVVWTTPDGKSVEQYLLRNRNGLSMTVLTLGAAITRLTVPDRIGKLGDVVLGFDDPSMYARDVMYIGTAIGRFGNRIAGGRFSIDGQSYSVPQNNGPNSLHGGHCGYDKRVWRANPLDPQILELTLHDPDGSEGYPGNVDVRMTYSLTDDNECRIEYWATTDRPTPINLTNHSYFNLKDGGRSSIVDHVVQIEADTYLPVNDVQIPMGRPSLVAGTAFDFTKAATIGSRIAQTPGSPNGYDHNFCLREEGECGVPRKCAEVFEPTSGRVMQVYTTEPGVQFYTGNFLDGTLIGKGQTPYHFRNGFCLETQHYPDSPNQPTFPNTILRPGQTYRQITVYRFGVSG
jgi:aldose 1-epimerase